MGTVDNERAVRLVKAQLRKAMHCVTCELLIFKDDSGVWRHSVTGWARCRVERNDAYATPAKW